MAASLVGLPEKKILPRPTIPQELVKQIAGFSSLISFRLHSHIVAGSLGIPGVSLVWDNKLRFYFESIGRPERSLSVYTDVAEILHRHDQAAVEGIDTALLDKIKKHARERLLMQSAQVLNDV